MTKISLQLFAVLVLWCSGSLCVCAGETLYARLGGDAGVAIICNTLIDRVATDPILGRSFRDSKLGRIKHLLGEQICELSGGPCRYSGDSMKEVHAGHQISEAEFFQMVEILRQVLKEQHTDLGTINQLLKLLAPMKRDIVEHRTRVVQ